ncbi:hypothetical protein BC832DRAFT_544567 [Gaertneriomyces semiglobifer]|nr:hypothetical protein BC832DRAFT_544567 [Gaertneriomyces semiglobifer]
MTFLATGSPAEWRMLLPLIGLGIHVHCVRCNWEFSNRIPLRARSRRTHNPLNALPKEPDPHNETSLTH